MIDKSKLIKKDLFINKIIETIKKDKNVEYTKKQIDDILKALPSAIQESIVENFQVRIQGLGTFKPKIIPSLKIKRENGDEEETREERLIEFKYSNKFFNETRQKMKDCDS